MTPTTSRQVREVRRESPYTARIQKLVRCPALPPLGFSLSGSGAVSEDQPELYLQQVAAVRAAEINGERGLDFAARYTPNLIVLAVIALSVCNSPIRQSPLWMRVFHSSCNRTMLSVGRWRA